MFRTLHSRDRAVHRASRRSGQRHRQPAALLLKFFIAGAFIMPRLNHHAVTGETDIPLRDDIFPTDMRLFARSNADVTAR